MQMSALQVYFRKTRKESQLGKPFHVHLSSFHLGSAATGQALFKHHQGISKSTVYLHEASLVKRTSYDVLVCEPAVWNGHM
jgi:hypothetical protein